MTGAPGRADGGDRRGEVRAGDRRSGARSRAPGRSPGRAPRNAELGALDEDRLGTPQRPEAVDADLELAEAASNGSPSPPGSG